VPVLLPVSPSATTISTRNASANFNTRDKVLTGALIPLFLIIVSVMFDVLLLRARRRKRDAGNGHRSLVTPDDKQSCTESEAEARLKRG